MQTATQIHLSSCLTSIITRSKLMPGWFRVEVTWQTSTAVAHQGNATWEFQSRTEAASKPMTIILRGRHGWELPYRSLCCAKLPLLTFQGKPPLRFSRIKQNSQWLHHKDGAACSILGEHTQQPGSSSL